MKREEAIEMVRKSWPISRNKDLRKALETLIPELAESEDERIRKDIIECVEEQIRQGNYLNINRAKVIAYLEKQKGLTTENNMISSKKCNKSPLTDEAFKEQLERVLRDNVLDTDIRITGDTVIGAKLKEYFEQKEQKPISSCDIVPYIDDKIAALQDMWREEKVAFDWDDMHEMIEDVARHFYQKEQKSVQSPEEKEYVRQLKALVSDFVRDKKPKDVEFYQQIWNWLDGLSSELMPIESD